MNVVFALLSASVKSSMNGNSVGSAVIGTGTGSPCPRNVQDASMMPSAGEPTRKFIISAAPPSCCTSASVSSGSNRTTCTSVPARAAAWMAWKAGSCGRKLPRRCISQPCETISERDQRLSPTAGVASAVLLLMPKSVSPVPYTRSNSWTGRLVADAANGTGSGSVNCRSHVVTAPTSRSSATVTWNRPNCRTVPAVSVNLRVPRTGMLVLPAGRCAWTITAAGDAADVMCRPVGMPLTKLLICGTLLSVGWDADGCLVEDAARFITGYVPGYGEWVDSQDSGGDGVEPGFVVPDDPEFNEATQVPLTVVERCGVGVDVRVNLNLSATPRDACQAGAGAFNAEGRHGPAVWSPVEAEHPIKGRAEALEDAADGVPHLMRSKFNFASASKFFSKFLIGSSVHRLGGRVLPFAYLAPSWFAIACRAFQECSRSVGLMTRCSYESRNWPRSTMSDPG